MGVPGGHGRGYRHGRSRRENIGFGPVIGLGPRFLVPMEVNTLDQGHLIGIAHSYRVPGMYRQCTGSVECTGTGKMVLSTSGARVAWQR